MVQINYEDAMRNHMRADAEKAIQLFISGEEGTSMVIFPQILNPLLKALESLGTWKQAIVVPYKDDKNKPLYIIVKISGNSIVSSLNVVKESKS